MMNPREEFVSVQEAAHIMGLDRSRVGRLCREGRFPGAAKVGSSWIIPREAVLKHKPLPPGVKSRSERVKAEQTALREEIEAAISAAKGEEG